MRIATAIETAVATAKLAGVKSDARCLQKAAHEAVRKLQAGLSADMPNDKRHIAVIVSRCLVAHTPVGETYLRAKWRLACVCSDHPDRDKLSMAEWTAKPAYNDAMREAAGDLREVMRRVFDILGYDLTDARNWEYNYLRGPGKEYHNPRLAEHFGCKVTEL